MGQRLSAWRRDFSPALVILILTLGFSTQTWAADQATDERTSLKVAALFDGHSDQTIDAFLMRLRPTPLDEASRAKVLASLPNDGEVRPSRKDSGKLLQAQRVLDYSCPSGAITMKVVMMDSAFVGLYYRTVVLVSAKALALLSAEELTALVAHETGHDVDWNDYWTAMKSQDNERMRELELKADGIAILTLEHLGIDPRQLESAIQKTIRYNDWQDRAAGATPQSLAFNSADRYVSLDERLAFIHAIEKMRWADWPAPESANLRQVRK